MNGRVYDPSIGRMISADPTVPGMFYSQSLNRYAYAINNPLRMVDPSGYCSVSVAGFSFGGGSDCTSTVVNDVPGLSTAVHDVGNVGEHVGQYISHLGYVAQNHVNEIIALVAAYYTAGASSSYFGAGFWGSVGTGAVAGGTYAGTCVRRE